MTITIADLLATKYVKHGRSIPDLDCWGLARIAWEHIFKKGTLPSYSHIDPMDKEGLTDSSKAVVSEFNLKKTEFRYGVLATAWKGARCVHIGAVVEVDGRLWVLETDEPTGPVLTNVKLFESRYSKVIYYDN